MATENKPPPPPRHERLHQVAVGVGAYLFAQGVFLRIPLSIAAGITIMAVSCRIHARIDDAYWASKGVPP